MSASQKGSSGKAWRTENGVVFRKWEILLESAVGTEKSKPVAG